MPRGYHPVGAPRHIELDLGDLPAVEGHDIGPGEEPLPAGVDLAS